MKKQILTLSIISSVLNLNTALAGETGIQKENGAIKGTVQTVFPWGTRGGGRLWFPELENHELQGRIIHVVKALIDASQLRAEGTALEKALDRLKVQILVLDSLYPEHAESVKKKIMDELLRTGVVIRDDDSFSLNDSIMHELEERGIVADVYAKRGVICFGV
ncbi:MAG: hypothetical protein A2X86_15970 [Bdellovibrionales bacterium GWA2_49_15]|nr:MAG: hypothetical protein A2X86_15970 [Bdellovibrionales bacterium GWA2_49_15]HAZ13181.1 hypothetical protein [Bdellovibrionales bacterium]